MKHLLFGVLILLVFSCSGSAVTGEAEEKNSTRINFPPDSIAKIKPEDQPKKKILPPPDYDTTVWTELSRIDPSIIIDMRYATDSNFVGEKMYDCNRCFLRPEVAEAIVSISDRLQKDGMRLKMLDCYRPRPVQWKLWEKVPDPRYVTDPEKGSMHNRGAAVDLTFADAEGKELEMGTPYDFFGRKAYHTFTELPDSVLDRRIQLKQIMEENGFRAIRTEWWHYSFTRKNYELSDMIWNCPG